MNLAFPSNNFAKKSAEIPWNLFWESVEIPRNFQESGKSGENDNSYSEEFLVTRSEKFLVTHSEEFLITLSKEFLVTNYKEFVVTNSAEKPEKMWTKFVEILGNFQWKVLQNQFLEIYWELFQRFSQEFLRNILKYSQHIPE